MSIPFRLNLEQQKKRAKELLKAVKAGQSDAQARFKKSHPKLQFNEILLSAFDFKLADAQLVIARELGSKTWLQLRAHIELMESLRKRVEQNTTVEDEPNACLHIRCGSDIQTTLPEAGFNGDFLEFSDPLCVGPVAYDYDIEERATYLFECFGEEFNQTYEAMREGIIKPFEQLQNSASRYENIVLWFEHDPYDQFILIFLLSFFHRNGLPKHVWLVTTNAFPGSARFQGLGQLPPEGLRLLWQSKQRVTLAQCLEADQHWKAYTNNDPRVFHSHVQAMNGSGIPFFEEAAERQLLEQPLDPKDHPLTQQLTLTMLKRGSETAGKLFGRLMREEEPLPFLGDAMYWVILKEMRTNGLVQFENTPRYWPETIVSLP